MNLTPCLVIAIAGLLTSCLQSLKSDKAPTVQSGNVQRDSAESLADDDEVAVPPENVTGSYLTCGPIDGEEESMGCNLAARYKKEVVKVKLDRWASDIVWGSQTEEDVDIDVEEDVSGYHAVFSVSPKKAAEKVFKDLRVKLELIESDENEEADYVLSSAIANLQGRGDSQLLPDEVDIYVDEDGGFGTKPDPDAELVKMPAVNDYTKMDGCYIACYSKNKKRGLYTVGDDIFVMGMVRVQGFYETGSSVCRPKDYEDADISAEKSFKDLCDDMLDYCSKRSCWAGGDTRGFLYK